MSRLRSEGRTLVVVLLVVAALLLVCVVSLLLLRPGTGQLSRPRIVELDLTQTYPDHVPEDALARSLFDGRPELRDVLAALDRAARDDSVVALVAKVGAVPRGLATIQELRDALEAFRSGGKKAVAYADTFGEWRPGNGAYYLASVFDEIHLQPSGDVGLLGLRYETPFVAGTLDLLGMEAQLDRRHEYKNAVDTYTETEFTPRHEEAMQTLVDSQFDQLVSGIAEGRAFDEAKVRELFDGGPYFGVEAVESGLVDAMAYRDEVYDGLRQEFGEDIAFVDLLEAAASPLVGLERGPVVALIHGVGAVVRGESRYDPLSGLLMGSDTVAEGFRQAIEDPSVRAILFRVDSPGGSYIASDTIWRETVRAREAGKPVVVSMGGVAASGGYFVAMAADRIVAQPGTITGSIGVYGGKFLNRGLWEKLGVTFDSVWSSANSEMWSSIEPFDERGWLRFEDALDRIYDDFVTKVANGRGLPREKVEELARGRVWTGKMALELGLVDALGGYRETLAEIREILGLHETASLRLRRFPRPRSTLELILERLSASTGGSPVPAWATSLVRLAERLRPLARALDVGATGPAPLSLREPGGMQ